MMAVIDVAIVGDDDEAAMVDRPEFALSPKDGESIACGQECISPSVCTNGRCRY
jgi:hypothetical protein